MKVIKNMLIIVIIFAFLQSIIMIKPKTATAAPTIIDDVVQDASNWNPPEGGDEIETEEVDEVVKYVYMVLRVIGGAIIMLSITITLIYMNMTNSGFDKGHAKLALTIMFVLAFIFLFAEPIFNGFVDFFTKLEGLLRQQ